MNVTQKIEANIWADDRLGFADIGQSFRNIIQTIDDSKVISIEAPFGYGKTFFRERWAEQLKAAGELVIQIDALQSDHSGDPLVTFVGALLSATPKSGKPLKQTTKEQLLKWGGILGRATLKAVLREGAEEIISAGADWAQGEAPDIEGIDKAVDALKDGLSSAAAQMIATHLAAEEARKVELPAQIDALRDALTESSENKRIVIIVDELDRCHPEYAISLLEAMKLVFGREGFVFVLMVNPNYIEDVARHRFGFRETEEFYLEKFVDIRLKLPLSVRQTREFAKALIGSIQAERTLGPIELFGVEPASMLAHRIVDRVPFSIRQIEKIVRRVDLVTKCYRGKALDVPLITFLAFKSVRNLPDDLQEEVLPRAGFSPSESVKLLEKSNLVRGGSAQINLGTWQSQVEKVAGELIDAMRERYVQPGGQPKTTSYVIHKVLKELGPTYIPSHQAMLDGVMRLQAE